MPTRAEVTAYATAQNAIVTSAKQRLSMLWMALGDRVWDVRAVRDALADVFPSLVADYGDAAATLAAEWFEAQIGAGAVLAPTIPARQAMSGAGWALDPILKGDPAQSLANLGLVLDRFVKQPGRDTIQQSARRSRVGWARVPTGVKTCAFCLLLAGRGAVYGSEESAGGRGNEFHADCDCVVTPVRSDRDLPAGYDPEALSQAYVGARKVAGGDTKAILAEMRKQQGIS